MTVDTETMRADAKALFETLDKLTTALRHVDYAGPADRVEALDDAHDEAEIVLQALDGDYA